MTPTSTQDCRSTNWNAVSFVVELGEHDERDRKRGERTKQRDVLRILFSRTW